MGACINCESTLNKVPSVPQQDSVTIIESPRAKFGDTGRKSTDLEISASSPESHPDPSSFKTIEPIDDTCNQNHPFKQNLPSIPSMSKINEMEENKIEAEIVTNMTQEIKRDSITITNMAKEGLDVVDIDNIKEPEGEPHIATTMSAGNDSIDSMIRKLSLPTSANKDDDNKTLRTRYGPKSFSKENTDDKFVNRYKLTSSSNDEEDNDGSTEREIKEKEASSETNSNCKSSNYKTKSQGNKFRCKPPKTYKSSSTEQSSTAIMKQEDYHSSSGSSSYFESITKLTTMTNIANGSICQNEAVNTMEKQSSPQTVSQQTISALSPATGRIIEPNTPNTPNTPCTTASIISSRMSLKFNQTSANKAIKPKSLVSIPNNVKQHKQQYIYHRAYHSIENPFYHSDQDHDAGDEQDDDIDDQIRLTHIITNDILNDDLIKRTKEGCIDETQSDDTFIGDEDSMVTDDESYSSYNWYQSFNRASSEKAIGHNITKMVRNVTADNNNNNNNNNSIKVKGIKTRIFKHTATPSIDSMDSAASGDSNVVHFDSTEAIKMPQTATRKQYSSTDMPVIHKRIRFRNNDITPRDSITRSLSMLPGLCGIPSKTPTNYAIHPRSKTYTPSFTHNGNLNLLAYYPKSGPSSSSCNSSMQVQPQMTSISSMETDDNDKVMLFKEPTPKDNDNVGTEDSINVNINNSASEKSVVFVTTPVNVNGDDNKKQFCGPPPPIYPPPLNTPINSSEDVETDNDGTPSTIEYNGINRGPSLPFRWIQNSANNSPYYQYTHYNYYYFDESDKQKVRQIPLQRPCPPPHTFNYYSNNKSDFDENNDPITPNNS